MPAVWSLGLALIMVGACLVLLVAVIVGVWAVCHGLQGPDAEI